MVDDTGRWSRVKQLFQDALERPADERGPFLHRACGADRELQNEVESLLVAHAAAGNFAQGPAIETLPDSAVATLRDGTWADQHGLQRGTRLGHYEMLSAIGKGGMGEVWKARDTTLKRDVAIKLLPEEFAQDADRLARFQREAQTLASLNHPNIAIIHGLEEADHAHALVMELVEGEDLSQRVARGAMPLGEALPIATQIAEALEAAHGQGIVHRDLKPANIKVRADGVVKVLDFGLAKLTAAQIPVAGSADSPTFGVAETEAGVVIGTAGYMSPEQARGEPIDKRADVWAFGVVLWEMLTGRRLFHGKSGPDTLAAVIRDEPDISKVPAKVRPLLRRCLEKHPRRRLRDIGDAMAIVENTPESPAGTTRQWAPWAAAIALLIPLGALSFLHFREQMPPQPVPVRFQIPPPSDKAPLVAPPVISPDGRRLAFIYQDRLWVHVLDTGESRDLTAADGDPFWSPNSRFIGFTSDGKLKKIEATGGPAQTVCALAPPWGDAAWNQDDVIIFGLRYGPIFKVPAGGGVPVPVTKVDPSRQETHHKSPRFLPDGRHFLYVRRADQNPLAYYVGSLDAKPEEQSFQPLLTTASGQPVYAPSADPRTGYLLFTREGALMAQPFDNGKRELTGQAVALVEQVANDSDGWDAFSVSANGVLAFQRGGAVVSQLTWFDRQGKSLGTVGEPAPYLEVRLSPDGKQAATVRRGANQDIWLVELARGTGIRLTSDPGDENQPVWSPDGSHIAFRQRGSGLVLKPSNGIGAPELLLKSDRDVYPTSWSQDGRFLLYSVLDPKTRRDIWVLPIKGDRKSAVVLNTEFNERWASLSPDGRWIYYTSDESGKNETYVRPFEPPSGNSAPVVGARRIVSIGGGAGGGWLDGGKTLGYNSPDRKIMVVEISTSPVFRVGAPQALFQGPNGAIAGDATADSKHFLFAVSVGKTSYEPYSVVLNWPALLTH